MAWVTLGFMMNTKMIVCAINNRVGEYTPGAFLLVSDMQLRQLGRAGMSSCGRRLNSHAYTRTRLSNV
jgi:hypothetical protein